MSPKEYLGEIFQQQERGPPARKKYSTSKKEDRGMDVCG